MSNYNTISAISESPVKEGLIYAGTDDGYINVTDNDGKNWKKFEVKKLPGAPEMSYVNDLKADNFDANTVYAVLDNHKYGDYKPYVYKSTNKGQTWKSISSNLPKKSHSWRIVQDHIKKDLLFLVLNLAFIFPLTQVRLGHNCPETFLQYRLETSQFISEKMILLEQLLVEDFMYLMT